MSKPRIGMVVAVEMSAVFRKYGEAASVDTVRGITAYKYENEKFDLFVINSGVGEIRAAAATRHLIDRYEVDLVLNFGAVGALSEDMKTCELCVVKSVIHYAFETTGWLNLKNGQYPEKDSPYLEADPELLKKVCELDPGIIPVVCASADKFVDRAEDKAYLRSSFRADICEMEAAGILYTCDLCGVPCLLIKAVSDTLMGGGAEFMRELDRVADVCIDVVDRLLYELYA